MERLSTIKTLACVDSSCMQVLENVVYLGRQDLVTAVTTVHTSLSQLGSSSETERKVNM